VKKHKILVTGAAGFVGSYVTRELVNAGYTVRAMIRRTSNTSLFYRLNPILDDIEIFEADLLDHARIERSVEAVDGVIHVGALFRQAAVNDDLFFKVNVEGTKKLIDVACASNIKRFIHCSTCGVVSSILNPPGDETNPYSPADVYQESKMEAEKLVLRYFAEGKISGIVIRPAMIYGPGDLRTLKLFKMLARNKFFYVGSGLGFVHWIDVRDLARSFRQSYEAHHVSNEVIIIAGKRYLPLKEMVNVVAEQLGVSKPWVHLPVKPMQFAGILCETFCKPFGIEPPLYKRRVDFFIKNRAYSTAKAKSLISFSPSMSLESEISDIISYYKNNGYM
jgi:dihydroflavonol-4-reductase